ncbi:MAG: helix-turn-helix domain-containing protein [Verrucomicrobiota bacterium]
MEHIQSNTNAVQVAAGTSTKPEWLRVPEAVRIFGLCRSSLYELIAAGKIKSTCLKKRGALRGIRIVSFDSLNSYIEASVEGGQE